MSAESLIREARLSAGLSQGKLAALADTSQPAVSAYENGTQSPNSDTLARLINACGATLVAIPSTSPNQATLSGMVAVLIENGEFDDEHFVLRWSLNQFARNEWDELTRDQKVEALRVSPQQTGSRRWDTFFAALADYLADVSQLESPSWITDPKRTLGDVVVWYPGRTGELEVLSRRVDRDPAPWFTRRGVGLEMRALPSGKGKHVAATV